MTTRQKGIERNLKMLAATISQLLTPRVPLSSKAFIIAKLNAKATANTYDSSVDPLVLISSLGAPIVGIASATSFVFHHNLGYAPIITIVLDPLSKDAQINIIGLTDTTVTLFNNSGDTKYLKIYAH